MIEFVSGLMCGVFSCYVIYSLILMAFPKNKIPEEKLELIKMSKNSSSETVFFLENAKFQKYTTKISPPNAKIGDEYQLFLAKAKDDEKIH